MWNSVEEAYRSCVSPEGIKLSDADNVSEENITKADHFILGVVNATVNMPDEQRVKYLHHAISCVLPFLQEVRPSNRLSSKVAFESLVEKIEAAYRENCEENWENPKKSFLRKMKTFSFDNFTIVDWDEVLEIIGCIEPSDYDSDVKLFHDVAQGMFFLCSLRENSERQEYSKV